MTARRCSIACLLAVAAAAPLAQRDASSPRDASSIRGRIVADGNDRPLRRALVTLTGVDRRVSPVLTDDEGRFEMQAPDSSLAPNGSFEVTGPPPGEYFVAAVDASPLDLQEPDTLESLVPRAARVTAREGAVSEVTLRLIRR
jgi:hypothetical protein